MDKTKKLLLLLTLLTLTATAQNPATTEGAHRYRGYDELIKNTTTLEYRNNTYHWIDYSKTFTYSGSALLDEKGDGVTDPNKILAFTAAKNIHENYRKENTEQITASAAYFTHITKDQKDTEELTEYSQKAAQHLTKCLDSFSPDDAEEYLRYENKSIEKMNEILADYLNTESNKTDIVSYERQYVLITVLSNAMQNREYLLKSARELAENVEARAKAKEKEPLMNPMLIGLALIVFASAVLITRLTPAKS